MHEGRDGMTSANKKLLVVDDEPDFCVFVSHVAKEMGCLVKTLTDSRRFRACYEAFDPDIVMLDMVMPEQDGFEVIDWLVEKKSGARVVLVTGYNPHYAKSAQIQAAARGLSEIKTFTKPISIRKLRAALS